MSIPKFSEKEKNAENEYIKIMNHSLTLTNQGIFNFDIYFRFEFVFENKKKTENKIKYNFRLSSKTAFLSLG